MKEKRKSKISIIFSVVMVLLLIPSVIFGANIENNIKKDNLKTNTEGTVFTLNKKDTYNKSIFMGTYTNILNEGKINGSVITASTSINNSGNINGSVISIAPNFTNSGVINKSVIGFYNNMYLNDSHIKKDLICYGNKVITNEKTVVNGDVNLYVDDVLLKGKVDGDVLVVGKSVTINGVINGNVKVGCNELVLGRDTRINGSLTYESPNPIVKTDQSKVKGSIKNEDLGFKIPSVANEEGSALAGFISYYGILNKISILLIAVLLFKLFPMSALKVELFTRRNVFKCLSVGAMTMLFIIPVIFILLITIVGMPVALHIASLYFDLTYIATIPTALVLGGLFIKGQNLSSKMLTGILVIFALDFLPSSFFSSVITLIANLIGIGSIVMLISLYLRFQIKRERTEYVTLMSINNSKEDIIRTKQKFEQMKSQKFEAAMKQKEEDKSNNEEKNTTNKIDDENDITRNEDEDHDDIDNKEDDTDE
ncbi:hypothetical protein [Anaerofustis stercorihominis]|uniref:hypothetical protein n=1 Tax=Anaerofustis stercorihominis TaxID=214853 RepID=UPI00214C0144|nr:hypothetical protein [Anaerofustis stercorihominis]MCR2032207.1 hypothetical protein [Anaerofustis stercorihominis]